jgi:hypothetical protein
LPIFSLAFLALLLSGILLGGMLCFTAMVAPLVFMKLPGDTAAKFIRQLFPIYYAACAVLALLAAAASLWSLPGVILALTGVASLFALLWLMPAINRNRDKGLAGDTAAMAVFERLHSASVALNALQILGVLVAFALIARGWG